jgi:chromosome segregation ATPase
MNTVQSYGTQAKTAAGSQVASQLVSAQGAVTATEGKITNLQGEMKPKQDLIAANTKTINDTNAKIKKIDDEINSTDNFRRKRVLQNQKDTLFQDIISKQNKNTTLTTALLPLQTKLAALQSQLALEKSKVQSLQSLQ